jgi:hypothetical protein
MTFTSSHVYFFVSFAVAILAFGLIAKFYLWPAIAGRDATTALTPLLLYACLRVNGLMFLMPGLVSPSLPAAFAVPVAYGDLTAVALALLALAALRYQRAAAVPAIWLFNLAGTADLVYANIASFTAKVDPVALGVSYYLAAINVPAMLVAHAVIFLYLVRGWRRAGHG